MFGKVENIKIELNKDLYSNSKILNALKNNFGKVYKKVHTINFVKSTDNFTAVSSGSGSYDAIQLIHQVLSFLEENFYAELKKIN